MNFENNEAPVVSTIKPDVEFTENDNLYRIIGFESEDSLDKKLEAVTAYMNENTGKGEEEHVKDSLYGQAQTLLNEFKMELRDAKFNFHLDHRQYKVLTYLLNHKLEYDVNSLFIALELTEMLENMHGDGNKFQENTVLEYPVTATEITYVYHLLAQHKVKGLTNEARALASILIRIGEISKLVSFYDTSSKNLVEDIQNWAMMMNEGLIEPGVDMLVEDTNDEV